MRSRRGLLPHDGHTSDPRAVFGEQDDWNSPHVAVISESLARQRWPNQDPIGQTIEFGNMDDNRNRSPSLASLAIFERAAWVFRRVLSYHLRRLPPARTERQLRAHRRNAQPPPSGEIVSTARAFSTASSVMLL
jgi:hypothetical protein